MRPRERLVLEGPHSLRDDELLAIVLRCGTRGRPVEHVARETLAYVDGLSGLSAAPLDELQQYCHLGRVQAITVTAVMELARRWAHTWRPPGTVIDSSQALFAHAAHALKDRPDEHCLVIALDARNRVLRTHWLSRGDQQSALVNARTVFAVGLACHAAGIALVHNHPSGDPQPSAADHELTAQLHHAAQALDMPLLDHLIIGNARYFSFRDAGLLTDEL